MFCDDLDGWDGVGEAQEGGDLCMRMADSLPCIAETNTTFKAIILKKKKSYSRKLLKLRAVLRTSRMSSPAPSQKSLCDFPTHLYMAGLIGDNNCLFTRHDT